MIPSFKEYFYQVYVEAKVLPFTSKQRKAYAHPDDYKPLKDSDVIRVYHGFRDLRDVVKLFRYGLSGKDFADRVYSYEYNNNPKGLFVSISPTIAKDFGNYVIEFQTKVSDLEAPVWPGGGYTVQGQMSQYFNGEEDREKARLNRRENAKKSKYDSIKNSDRPELAELLYSSGEAQALFVGELNANSVRAVWVNPNPKISARYSTLERITPKEFMQKFANTPIKNDDNGTHSRMLKPRDKFDKDTFFKLMQKHSGDLSEEVLVDIFKNMDDRELLMYVWPNQLEDFKKILTKL
jgi:hypothetical protein